MTSLRLSGYESLLHLILEIQFEFDEKNSNLVVSTKSLSTDNMKVDLIKYGG